MGVEIQQAIALPGQTVILNFNNPLQAWVVGMNMFSLTYGPNTDHWVETISISLQTNQPTTSMIGNQLGVTVHAQLQDASGHTIYVDGSSGSQIGVTCVAITGSNDPQTYMGNVTGIANNTSVPVELPGSGGSFTALTSCLSGFNLSFNTTDHHFAGAVMGTGIAATGTTGQISGVASLYDASGNRASTTTVDAGYIASVNPSPPFMTQVINKQSQPPFAVTFPQNVSQIAILLQNITVQFPSGGDNNLQTILAGGFTIATPSGPSSGPFLVNPPAESVTLNQLITHVNDNSGHWEDDNISSVTALVIGLPAAS